MCTVTSDRPRDRPRGMDHMCIVTTDGQLYNTQLFLSIR